MCPFNVMLIVIQASYTPCPSDLLRMSGEARGGGQEGGAVPACSRLVLYHLLLFGNYCHSFPFDPEKAEQNHGIVRWRVTADVRVVVGV